MRVVYAIGGGLWYCLVVGGASKVYTEMVIFHRACLTRQDLSRYSAVLEREKRCLLTKMAFLDSPRGKRYLMKIRGQVPEDERLVARTGLRAKSLEEIRALIPGGLEEWTQPASTAQQHRRPTVRPVSQPAFP